MIPELKVANISYSENPICKTLSVPLITEKYTFGTAMQDPIWKNAAAADDFVLFKQEGVPGRRTSLAMFRTGTHLVLGFFFEEDAQDRTHLPADFSSMWQGDLAELHFGGTEPDPWLLQLAVGIDGNRFDSAGAYTSWDIANFFREDGWGAEVRIDLKILRLTEGGVRFNLVRESLKRKERIVWSPLRIQYHEVQNFGELLFCSYQQAASLRAGMDCPTECSRQDFENMRAKWEIPAHQIVHGPFLSCPDRNSVCITWKTAGKVPAYITYRAVGSGESPKRVNAACSGGIHLYESVHFAQLKGLDPDTEYQYEIFSLFPVSGTLKPAGIKRTFRTQKNKSADYSFFLFTDLHSDVQFLRKALAHPAAENAAFWIALGDNLSYASGMDAVFDGVIDPIVQAQKSYTRDIPLVFVRGNHEELGVYAAEYFNVMRHPTGNTWYSFSQGDVFFVVLDSGDDKPDSPDRPFFENSSMFAEEQQFLEQVVQTPEYRNAAFRIILMHIPPLPDWQLQRNMVMPLQNAEILPDLMICGHEHKNIWKDANDPEGFAFPIQVCSNKNVLSCTCSHDMLQIELLDTERDTILKTVTFRK